MFVICTNTLALHVLVLFEEVVVSISREPPYSVSQSCQTVNRLGKKKNKQHRMSLLYCHRKATSGVKEQWCVEFTAVVTVNKESSLFSLCGLVCDRALLSIDNKKNKNLLGPGLPLSLSLCVNLCNLTANCTSEGKWFLSEFRDSEPCIYICFVE